MLSPYLVFLISILFLIVGSELTIRGALRLSFKLNLSETFIGLTILAIGTDFPEIMIAVTGAIEKTKGFDASNIIVGNIIGSNMGQIGLILGIIGLFKGLSINKKQIIHNGLMLIVSTVVFFLVAMDNVISRTEGLIMLGLYLLYTLIVKEKAQTWASKFIKKVRKKKGGVLIPIMQLALGLLIMGKASHYLLDSSLSIARIFNVSDTFIGIVLVGVGTSLPELIVSINALVKGSIGLSVGNLIGSNIVDVLVALGLGATISNINVNQGAISFDIPYLMIITVVVVLFMISRYRFERRESVLVLSLYFVYIALKFFNF